MRLCFPTWTATTWASTWRLSSIMSWSTIWTHALGGDLKPSMLVEGLAVYLSGGHYKPEPLLPRLAALLPPEAGCMPVAQALAGGSAQAVSSRLCGLNRYIPLEDLLDHFYFAQHEIGYLEAGSLVEFMVDTWGWTAFSSFYRDIHPLENPTAQPAGTDLSQSRAVEAALQRHFGLTLAQLEARFLASLEGRAGPTARCGRYSPDGPVLR